MSNPICTIIAWYGDPLKRPKGYEYCNGDIIDIVTFKDLYGYLVSANPKLYISPTQAHLPDLKEQFLRGWDNMAAAGSRALGSAQGDAFGSHSHGSSENVGYIGAWHGGFGGDTSCNPVVRKNSGGGMTPFATTAMGDTETRPKNVAISFLIKSSKNGEESQLMEIVEGLPADFPADIRAVLQNIAAGS